MPDRSPLPAPSLDDARRIDAAISPERRRRVVVWVPRVVVGGAGTVLSARALTKLRRRERGWRYGVELLVAHGAPPPSGDWDGWLRDAVARVTRAVRHPGNHRYVWVFDRTLARHVPASLAYPKVSLAGGAP